MRRKKHQNAQFGSTISCLTSAIDSNHCAARPGRGAAVKTGRPASSSHSRSMPKPAPASTPGLWKNADQHPGSARRNDIDKGRFSANSAGVGPKTALVGAPPRDEFWVLIRRFSAAFRAIKLIEDLFLTQCFAFWSFSISRWV